MAFLDFCFDPKIPGRVVDRLPALPASAHACYPDRKTRVPGCLIKSWRKYEGLSWSKADGTSDIQGVVTKRRSIGRGGPRGGGRPKGRKDSRLVSA